MEDLQNNYSPLGTLSPSVTLSLAARAKELKKQGLDVYSMSVGEPDFDTPQAIKDVASCGHSPRRFFRGKTSRPPS